WPVCSPGIIPSKLVVSKLISNPTSSAIALIKSISKPTYSPSSLNSNGTKDVSVATVYESFKPFPSASAASSLPPQAASPNKNKLKNKILPHVFHLFIFTKFSLFSLSQNFSPFYYIYIHTYLLLYQTFYFCENIQKLHISKFISVTDVICYSSNKKRIIVKESFYILTILIIYNGFLL